MLCLVHVFMFSCFVLLITFLCVLKLNLMSIICFFLFSFVTLILNFII